MPTCLPATCNMLTLIAMKGHPATGKSTLAQALARRLGWPLIDKDDVKDNIVHVSDCNALAYDIFWQIVETQLRLGLSVIADSPLSYPESYRTAGILAQLYGAKLWVVETRLEEALWQTRLEERGKTMAENHRIHSWTDMEALLARYDGCWQYEIASEEHLVLDSGEALESLVDAALKSITKTSV